MNNSERMKLEFDWKSKVKMLFEKEKRNTEIDIGTEIDEDETAKQYVRS